MLMFTVYRSGGRRGLPVPFPALLLMLVFFAGANSACTFELESAAAEQAGAADETTAAEQAEERVAETSAEPGFLERILQREPESVTVPPGTVFTVRLLDTASSHASATGETIRASVVDPVTVGDTVAIPAGATVIGRVEDAHIPKIGGRARLRVDFVSLELPSGESVPVSGSLSAVGKSEAGKDAAAIAGGAAAGAILGHQVEDDDEGKVVGGVVGGGIGSAIAHRTKGKAVVFPAGTVVELRLDAPVTVEVEA
jgi:hypothetical protein